MLTAATVAAMTAAAGLVGVVPAQAAPVIRVRCPAQDLQAAINNASAGSTLQVSGICTGNFVITKNLTLTGRGATLDGNHTGSVVTIFGTAQVLLTRLTITNGTGANNGGGVFMDPGTALTLNHSTVQNNSATFGGGGIEDGSSTLNLDRSMVDGNTANVGGGIINAGSGSPNSGTVTLTSSTVQNNTALAGGGIYEGLNAGPVTLIRSTVTKNTADHCAPPGSVPGCTG
ncbi:hypothetical protein [Streptomyces sp. NPDC002078]